MTNVEFYKRYENDSLIPTYDFFQKKIKGLKGIRPEFCPAIRDFYKLGWVLGSPIEVNFLSKRDFYVDCYKSCDNNYFMSPGVIGDLNSETLYARIDTGYSFVNLNVPILSIKFDSLDWDDQDISIPPNLYPAGYTGPILIPLSCNSERKVQKFNPLIQLIPFGQKDCTHDVITQSIKHEAFEGLYFNAWELKYPERRKFISSNLLNELVNKGHPF